MDYIICLWLVLVVVFCGLVFVKHSNSCWLLFIFCCCDLIFIFFFLYLYHLLLLLLLRYISIYPLSIVSIFLLIVPFASVHITFNSFIPLESIIHVNDFNINYQINLISFYFNWLFQSFLIYVIITALILVKTMTYLVMYNKILFVVFKLLLVCWLILSYIFVNIDTW